ncbi:MAG: hypothetical protein A2157_11780 [Deltaproteobacteria bacterium RBG_16_47_11]|nr:MAG: hypothetical protein A2157_11780 [Deltaproteobacteria bacterium RBG_16_47_11]
MRGNILTDSLKRFLRNRNVILTSALLMGLFRGKGARWTEPIILPALAIVMTLSTIGLPASTFRSYRSLLIPAIIGIVMNYFVLGIALLVLNAILIHDEALRMGFILIAAVPPAVAVIPFTFFLRGDETLSLIGTTGGYLGALIIMPISALLFLGPGFVDVTKLAVILLELILFPVIVSRLLLRIGIASRLN